MHFRLAGLTLLYVEINYLCLRIKSCWVWILSVTCLYVLGHTVMSPAPLRGLCYHLCPPAPFSSLSCRQCDLSQIQWNPFKTSLPHGGVQALDSGFQGPVWWAHTRPQLSASLPCPLSSHTVVERKLVLSQPLRCVTLGGKRHSHLKDFEIRYYPGSNGWGLNVILNIFIRGRGEIRLQKSSSNLTKDAEKLEWWGQRPRNAQKY